MNFERADTVPTIRILPIVALSPHHLATTSRLDRGSTLERMDMAWGIARLVARVIEFTVHIHESSLRVGKETSRGQP